MKPENKDSLFGEKVLKEIPRIATVDQWYGFRVASDCDASQSVEHTHKLLLATALATFVLPINPFASLIMTSEVGRQFWLAYKHARQSDDLYGKEQELLSQIDTSQDLL